MGQEALTHKFSKVPEVTLYFWIIKVLCTTVGETAADFLNVNLSLGLTGTSIVMGVLLAVALAFQFATKKYVPSVYWITVVLISVFGTLVTDNLSDNFGVPLEVSTIVFFGALMATFSLWFVVERTLSIHSIFTARREVFYWLAILFTFALGTAAGDLLAERLGLGYLVTGLLIVGIVATIAVAWKFRLDAILSFWIVYILTRPLGASLGDLLSQSTVHGGLGLGPTVTSVIFLVAIVATVAYLSVTKADLTPSSAILEEPSEPRVVAVQLAVVLVLLVGGSVSGYDLRQNQLKQEAALVPSDPSKDVNTAPAAVVPFVGPLGDLTEIKVIVDDCLALVVAGKLADSAKRADDLEYLWDQSQANLKPKSPKDWTTMDSAIDKVLRQFRAVHQDTVGCKAALDSLEALLNGDLRSAEK